MIADLYRPGASRLHRAPAGAKLAGLAAIGTGLFMVPSLPLSCVAFAAALGAIAAAGLGWRFAAGSLRAALPVVLLVAAVQAWFASWHEAALYGVRLAALLVLAGLVTATTRPSAIAETIAWLLRPMRMIGVDPARVGLAFGLAVRFVPVLASVAADIREAQAARGLDRSVFALAVPLTLRTLRMADEIAEAIDARS